MKWLRLYHSVMDSVKVRTLPGPAHQLDYFLLLCCAGEYRAKCGRNTGETGLTIGEAMWRLRREGRNVPGNVPDGVPGNEWPSLEQTFPSLHRNGLAHLDDALRIVLDDWERYQFASDDVTSRTKKSKDKTKRNVPRNVPRNPARTKRGVLDTEAEGSSVSPNGDTAAAAARLMTKDEVWKVGKEMLAQQGVGPKTTGSYIGHLIKSHGEEQVLAAFRRAIGEQPADLRAWLKGALQHKKAKATARESVADAMFGEGDERHEPIDITGQVRRVA